MSQPAILKGNSVSYQTPSSPAKDVAEVRVFDYRDGTHRALHEITFFKRDNEGNEARVEGVGRGMVTGDFLLVSGSMVNDPKTKQVAFKFLEVAQEEDNPFAFTGRVKEHTDTFDL